MKLKVVQHLSTSYATIKKQNYQRCNFMNFVTQNNIYLKNYLKLIKIVPEEMGGL
jgi:hypothetical protein|nr:MAG TPA: hypothetical protein [Caudoviricetes sp.]